MQHYKSTRTLFNSLCALIEKFGGLPHTEASLLAQAVLASWFADLAPVRLNMALIGSPGPERRQLLRLLQCLLRRALPISEVSVAAISSLPMEIAPTLLLEHCELNPQFQRFLLTTSGDAQIVAKGRVLPVSCNKVLCSEESNTELAPGWPELEIELPQSWGPTARLDSTEAQRIADEFQPQLQFYRLFHYAAVRDAVISVPNIPSRARETAGALLACVVGDPELRAHLHHLLDEHFAPRGIWSTPKVELLAVLLAVSHGKQSTVSVGEMTKKLNDELERQGETLVLQPRAVGHLLRTLGFETQRLGSRSRELTLSKFNKERIHALHFHGMLGNHTDADCELCQSRVESLIESVK
ncbi:MAG: hypothetical protein WBR26_00775 [Candidatus Acidiferrum sp.]